MTEQGDEPIIAYWAIPIVRRPRSAFTKIYGDVSQVPAPEVYDEEAIRHTLESLIGEIPGSLHIHPLSPTRKIHTPYHGLDSQESVSTSGICLTTPDLGLSVSDVLRWAEAIVVQERQIEQLSSLLQQTVDEATRLRRRKGMRRLSQVSRAKQTDVRSVRQTSNYGRGRRRKSRSSAGHASPLFSAADLGPRGTSAGGRPVQKAQVGGDGWESVRYVSAPCSIPEAKPGQLGFSDTNIATINTIRKPVFSAPLTPHKPLKGRYQTRELQHYTYEDPIINASRDIPKQRNRATGATDFSEISPGPNSAPQLSEAKVARRLSPPVPALPLARIVQSDDNGNGDRSRYRGTSADNRYMSAYRSCYGSPEGVLRTGIATDRSGFRLDSKTSRSQYVSSIETPGQIVLSHIGHIGTEQSSTTLAIKSEAHCLSTNQNSFATGGSYHSTGLLTPGKVSDSPSQSTPSSSQVHQIYLDKLTTRRLVPRNFTTPHELTLQSDAPHTNRPLFSTNVAALTTSRCHEGEISSPHIRVLRSDSPTSLRNICRVVSVNHLSPRLRTSGPLTCLTAGQISSRSVTASHAYSSPDLTLAAAPRRSSATNLIDDRVDFVIPESHSHTQIPLLMNTDPCVWERRSVPVTTIWSGSKGGTYSISTNQAHSNKSDGLKVIPVSTGQFRCANPDKSISNFAKPLDATHNTATIHVTSRAGLKVVQAPYSSEPFSSLMLAVGPACALSSATPPKATTRGVQTRYIPSVSGELREATSLPPLRKTTQSQSNYEGRSQLSNGITRPSSSTRIRQPNACTTSNSRQKVSKIVAQPVSPSGGAVGASCAPDTFFEGGGTVVRDHDNVGNDGDTLPVTEFATVRDDDSHLRGEAESRKTKQRQTSGSKLHSKTPQNMDSSDFKDETVSRTKLQRSDVAHAERRLEKKSASRGQGVEIEGSKTKPRRPRKITSHPFTVMPPSTGAARDQGRLRSELPILGAQKNQRDGSTVKDGSADSADRRARHFYLRNRGYTVRQMGDFSSPRARQSLRCHTAKIEARRRSSAVPGNQRLCRPIVLQPNRTAIAIISPDAAGTVKPDSKSNVVQSDSLFNKGATRNVHGNFGKSCCANAADTATLSEDRQVRGDSRLSNDGEANSESNSEPTNKLEMATTGNMVSEDAICPGHPVKIRAYKNAVKDDTGYDPLKGELSRQNQNNIYLQSDESSLSGIKPTQVGQQCSNHFVWKHPEEPTPVLINQPNGSIQHQRSNGSVQHQQSNRIHADGALLHSSEGSQIREHAFAGLSSPVITTYQRATSPIRQVSAHTVATTSSFSVSPQPDNRTVDVSQKLSKGPSMGSGSLNSGLTTTVTYHNYEKQNQQALSKSIYTTFSTLQTSPRFVVTTLPNSNNQYNQCVRVISPWAKEHAIATAPENCSPDKLDLVRQQSRGNSATRSRTRSGYTSNLPADPQYQQQSIPTKAPVGSKVVAGAAAQHYSIPQVRQLKSSSKVPSSDSAASQTAITRVTPEHPRLLTNLVKRCPAKYPVEVVNRDASLNKRSIALPGEAPHVLPRWVQTSNNTSSPQQFHVVASRKQADFD